MPAYISFTNKTLFPVISVYGNDKLIEENILLNSPTKNYRVDSGSVEFSIRQNEKPFQSLWVSLYPNEIYELIIKNSGSDLFEK